MDKNNKKIKLRLKYLFAFFLLLIIEVLIALFVHDKFVRPYLGDVLVVIVIYCGIRTIILDRYKLLSLSIFLFAVGVEVLQYFNFVKLLGLENDTFLRILFGSTFDIKDVVCYGIGCILLFGYERIVQSPA